LGLLLESLNGRYVAAEDVGTDVNDMEYIFMETSQVVGVAQTHGAPATPLPWTARGVLEGLRACVEAKLGRSDFEGLSVAVQGAGHVGSELTEQFLDHRHARFTCVTSIPRAVSHFAIGRLSPS
jgi:leucine dehydrogenase